MKRAAIAFGLFIGLMLAVLLVKTALFEGRQVAPETAAPFHIDVKQAAKRLSQAIQLQTISSRDDARASTVEFQKLHQHVTASFPLAHSTLKRETVSESSLLYTWRGKNPERPAILLAAHLDVVPADPEQWEYPPFAGEIAGDFLWGRGALDDKASAMAILEAVETLLESKFSPARSIYLAFGHDEEVGGANGAAAIASLLRSRNVALDFVLDEGGAVTHGIIPLDAPVATIGIAEKGYLTLELSAAAPGGHSMNPPPQSAIGTLSRAVAKLEAHPSPTRISGATRELFNHIGPEMQFLRRAVFANLWLFSPLVEWRLAQTPATNAAIRTTIAATIFQAGARENVLPAKASATVNLRLLPGDSVNEVISRVRQIIDDEGIGVEVSGKAFEPSRVASTESAAYAHLAQTIRTLFPDALVAPYLVPGATDARHYAPLAENVYRFLALPLTSEDLKRFHGVNERIALGDYARLIGFYHELISTLN